VQAPPAAQKKPLWQSESAAQVVHTDAPPPAGGRQTPTLPLLPTHSVEDVQMQDPNEESEELVSQVWPLELFAQSASLPQTQDPVCVRQWLRAGLPLQSASLAQLATHWPPEHAEAPPAADPFLKQSELSTHPVHPTLGSQNSPV
jgi:hypothetical protein